ncbi:hypothetical protein JK636_17085 [Clostridium sp. YIM B02515]|uniref:Uncharacterized protein n=1 Tax=Clostridium rhizosphaerae TaxID=2803861 RepID=A0ABS1TDJ0_9CLOT|nr:hypothetical protein [Clostridium rhizosphaerae]MBL4937438.1 hypothetical protein [Clostridium rhizosphaerae]
MGNFNILEKIKQYRTVSIIGMDKNVGKTTVLNHILGEARGKLTLGLTSIGRDGEDKDRVIGTDKPRIFIESGNFIATAKECLFNGDITKEIIETTGINTPMGEVIIAKALSDGYVELGGPSVNNYMKEICDKLSNLGSELILVDGALSRKTMASPAVTEACILSTGASLNRSMNKVVEMTSLSVKLLSLEKEADKDVIKIIKKELSHSRIGIIYKNKETKNLEAATSLEAAKEIVEELNDDVSHVLIRGIVSDKLLEDILKSTDKYKGVTFLVEDGTKLFLKNETFEKFVKMGGILKAVNKVNLVCITCNPRSPSGYEFNKNMFLEKLSQAVSLPVIDVKA